MLRAIFQIASMIGLGATVERWFFDDDGAQPASPVRGVAVLLAVAGIIYLVYKFIGKKIRIG
jgi:hypothetical protein